MIGFGALLTLVSIPGCRLFGAVQEVTDLLDDPITMQGWYVGVELPPGIDLDGTTLDLGAQAQAWVQKTSTSGISVVDGAKVSLMSDRFGSVSLTQDGDSWLAYGVDGLRYQEEDEIRLVVDYGGERASIRMETPVGAVVDIPEEHTAGVSIRVDIRDQGFDNGGVLVYDLTPDLIPGATGLSGVVHQSEYDSQTPVDPDNLVLDVPGEVFEPGRIYGVGVLGMRASTDEEIFGLNELGSGMAAGLAVFHAVSTM
ncbi:MAG: hypothetical protein VX127_13625 [Myxococcota bacterium]|nr:hypothetical protein [Myxococcota bacterium]